MENAAHAEDTQTPNHQPSLGWNRPQQRQQQPTDRPTDRLGWPSYYHHRSPSIDLSSKSQLCFVRLHIAYIIVKAELSLALHSFVYDDTANTFNRCCCCWLFLRDRSRGRGFNPIIYDPTSRKGRL